MYYIVEFLATVKKPAETAIVPASWFVETGHCHWPPFKDPSSAVKGCAEPGGWEQFAARILKAFPTYSEARRKIKDSERTSDLSEVDQPPETRTRKRPLTVLEASSDEEEEDSDESKLPMPPPPPKFGNGSSPGSSCALFRPANIPHATAEASEKELNYYTIELPESQDEMLDDAGFTITLPELSNQPDHLDTSRGSVMSLPGTPAGRTSSQITWTQKELQNYIVENFATIKNQNRQIDAKLDCLLARVQDIERENHVSVLPADQINTLEDLDNFEEKLQSNPEFYNSVVTELSRLGGDTHTRTVFAVMRRVWGHDISASFSLFGKKGKRDFSKLTFYKVLLKATHNNAGFTGITDKMIQKSVQSYFRHA